MPVWKNAKEECQARDQDKLFFHFNMAVATVSWVKATRWLGLPQQLASRCS